MEFVGRWKLVPAASISTYEMQRLLSAGAVIVLIFCAAALAADRLSGPYVKHLLTGSQVQARTKGKSVGVSSIAMEQSGSRQEDLTFAADGSVERSSVGKMKTHTETDEWWGNKTGKLCMKWPEMLIHIAPNLLSYEAGKPWHAEAAHKAEPVGFPEGTLYRSSVCCAFGWAEAGVGIQVCCS